MRGTKRVHSFVLPPSLSLCSLNSSHTKHSVIPPLIIVWRAVCLPPTLLLSPPEIKCSVVTTLGSYTTVWGTTGPEQALVFSCNSYNSLISFTLNLCIYGLVSLSAPFPVTLIFLSSNHVLGMSPISQF